MGERCAAFRSGRAFSHARAAGAEAAEEDGGGRRRGVVRGWGLKHAVEFSVCGRDHFVGNCGADCLWEDDG